MDIVQATWSRRQQYHSPASGLDLITYPWVASTYQISRELDFTPRHTSRRT